MKADLKKYLMLAFSGFVWVFLSSCVFFPKTSQHYEAESECQLRTPVWELSSAQLVDAVDGDLCAGSGEEALACLVALGAIIPAGSFVVSGSIVLMGNTVHWLEYQGHCEDGVIQKGLALLRKPKADQGLD